MKEICNKTIESKIITVEGSGGVVFRMDLAWIVKIIKKI